VDERCLPAWTRRRVSDGRDVRTERSVRRLSTVSEEDTVIGIADKSLAKIRKTRCGV